MPFFFHVNKLSPLVCNKLGNCTHVVHKSLNLQDLNRFKYNSSSLYHSLPYCVSYCRINLCRSPVYAVLMKLAVMQFNKNFSARLSCKRSAVHHLLKAVKHKLNDLSKLDNAPCSINKGIAVVKMYEIMSLLCLNTCLYKRLYYIIILFLYSSVIYF